MVVVKKKMIPLVEVFGPTVQGEGFVIGQQTYFLRFGLCDYKCKLCDSMHAVDPQQVRANASWLSQEGIYTALEQIYKQDTTRWVTLSGGNPCIHDITQLVRQLGQTGWKIAVETQGTLAPDWLYETDVVTVSPKTPGIGEGLELDVLDTFMSKMWRHNKLNMKVVVFSQQDLEVAAMLYERYALPRYMHPNMFYLSLGNPYPPGSDLDPRSDLRAELIERYKQLLEDIMIHPMLSQVKFLPQWHVIVWGNKKGV